MADSGTPVDGRPDVAVDAPVDVPADTSIIVYPMADAGPTAPVYAGEILKNGDFEISDGLGWLTEWENMDNNPDGEINVVADPHRFGSHAVQWQMDAAGDGREYYMIQWDVDSTLLVPGQTYELTGYYMFDHTGNIAFNYILRGQPNNTPNIDTSSGAITPVTVANTWLPFAFDLTIPLGVAPTTYEFYLHSIKHTGQPARMTVDGVSLHPKP